MSHLLAGFGKADITPAESVPLNESHWCDQSKGVHSPLYVRSVSFRSGSETALAISCDVIAISNELAMELRSEISATVSVSREFILLAATQNHSSPKIIPADKRDVKGFDSPALQQWQDEFVRQVVDSARDAVSNLGPVRIGYGEGEVPGIAGNRRPLRSDGSAVMTWYRPEPSSIADPGFEDPTLRVLKVENEDRNGKHGAILNFPCHPNTLWTTELVASDFPGKACDVIEQQAGPRLCPVYFNGCCGNIDPFKYMQVPVNAFTAPGAFELGAPVHLCIAESNRFGEMIGAEAKRVLENIDTKDEPCTIRSSTTSFDGPLREGMNFESRVAIQAIAIGDSLAFLGIPGEPFLEIERDIRVNSPFEATIICGQANGFSGYMPTRVAYDQGGYETGNSWTKFGPGIGEMVVEASLAVLDDVRNCR